MTVTNDFLPIATEGTPNVQSQADYAGSTEQQQGFALGQVPPSDQFNKMLRQASLIASQFAQMVCDYSGLDMLDDGDTDTLLETIKTQFRIKLQADTTFYVATTGNNSNTGLAIGSPWLTLQHAIDVIIEQYDFNGKTVTIQVADGTYTGTVIVAAPAPGQKTAIVINGNNATPTNVIMNVAGNAANTYNNGWIQVQHMKILSTGYALRADTAGHITIGAGVTFGACTLGVLYGLGVGALVEVQGDFSVVGSSPTVLKAFGGGSIGFSSGRTVSVVGDWNWSTAFAQVNTTGVIDTAGATFTTPGSAPTGKRYDCQGNGIVNTNGGGANVLPGDSAGTTTTGGQYT